ncbi:hypothetical protein MTO96_019749 [Rhipicephalus appendiculatus]
MENVTTNVLLLLLAHGLVVESATKASRVDVTTATPSSAATVIDEDYVDYVQLLRGALAQGFASIPNSMKTKLLGADVSAECLAGLLRTLRGFLNLEPWVVKLLDASGKFPTGLMQGSRVDLGAFDECLETEVLDSYGNVITRGQYCNLLVYIENSTALEGKVNGFSSVLHPKILYFKNYFSVTELPVVRMGICFVQECSQRDLQALVDTVKLPLVRLEVSNCVTAEAEAWSNAEIGIIGFFLCLTVSKQPRSGPIAFIVGVVRRYIRTAIPLFFIIMCLYVMPRFILGPDTPSFFHKLYEDVDHHWWHLLLMIRNFVEITAWDVLPHTWYLSTDFQLFAISLAVLLLFKSRKMVAVGAFLVLSLVGCAIATCAVAGSDLPPSMMFPGPVLQTMSKIVNEYYIRPYYHAVCYFSGCMTYLLMNDFRQRKMSKVVEVTGWLVSVSSALLCVFVKLAWYRSPNPTSEAVKLLAAFFDRILWAVSLSWITLACSSGRGGFVSKFLSWNAFVPLSKLSFGVYLIHLPFIELLLHASRERITWSKFNMLIVSMKRVAECALVIPGHNESEAVASSGPNNTVGETEKIDYGRVLRDVVAAGLSKVPQSLVRKLLAADIRLECSTALLRTVRAIQNFEPWVLRLIDATGKYPSGLLEGSRVDMGAFDECLDTVVRDRSGNVLSRGQYCNLLFHIDSAAALESIINYMSDVIDPMLVYYKEYVAPVGGPFARLALCYIDDCNQHDLQALVNAGLAFQVASGFSVKSNTQYLLNVASKDQVEQHSLQFLHGIRCLATTHVLIGHVTIIITDSCTRVLSLFQGTTEWPNVIKPAAINGVDTFFFLRICVPLFFVIMWFYLLPRFVDGPDTKNFFQKFYDEMSEQWWMYIVHIRNFHDVSLQAMVCAAVLVWSVVFSYLAFITCEAPTAALDRLAFGRLTGRASNRKMERQEELDCGDLKTINGRGEGN